MPFSEIVSKFIDQLKPLADGKSEIPMKVKFGEFTLDVISQVQRILTVWYQRTMILFLMYLQLIFIYIHTGCF